jgi:hypothetical protein
MKKMLYLLIVFLGLAQIVAAQTIPKELWGKWVVSRVLPTNTISCWGNKEARKLIGTELEYSANLFRWAKVIINNPTPETATITAEQFHDENSGGSANGSQVTFSQLGIKGQSAVQVVIRHSPADISGATIEIPGDNVLIKDKDTIIFSVCNVYFQAKRRIVSR